VAKREEAPAEETQPLIFGSQATRPTIRFASETEVEEALGGEARAIAEPRAAVAEPRGVVAEPVAAAAPVQRPAYPVSSYYETARQQAWQSPAPRVEYAPQPVEDFEPVRPVVAETSWQVAPEAPRQVGSESTRHAVPAIVEEPRAFDSFESAAAREPVAVSESVAAPIPVVVEHIPEIRVGSEAPRAAEGFGVEAQGAGHGTGNGAPGAKEQMPELVPVRASVFDDDFFRRPKEELAARAGDDASKAWPDARVPSFAGYAGDAPAENDELDIPAFLRRKP